MPVFYGYRTDKPDFRPMWYSPGTILVFSGRGTVPRAVRWATCSPYTHAAILAEITVADLVEPRECRKFSPARPWAAMWTDGLYVVESTTLHPQPCLIQHVRVDGVQVHPPLESIADYDGKVWGMDLIDPLDAAESYRLTQILLDMVGTSYDTLGAGLAGTRVLKHFCPWAHRQQGPHYCIELIGRALNYALQGRVLPEIQPGELSPAELVRLMVRSRLFYKPYRIK